MTDVLEDPAVLAERYLAAWNEPDAAARRQAVAALYAPDARYVDPLVDARGHEAIDATIAAVQAQFPGSVLRLAGPVDAHHDVARFSWELVPAGAPEDAPAPVVGFDVAVTDGQGRLQAVLGFLDRVPAGRCRRPQAPPPGRLRAGTSTHQRPRRALCARWSTSSPPRSAGAHPCRPASRRTWRSSPATSCRGSAGSGNAGEPAAQAPGTTSPVS
jgi:hypothetical protein